MSESKIITATICNQSIDELIHILLQYASDNNYGVALWRLPESEITNLIIAHTPESIKTNTIEEFTEGFIFAPFDRSRTGYYLKADLHFCFLNKSIATPTTPLQAKSIDKLNEIITSTVRSKFTLKRKISEDIFDAATKANFEQLVEKSIKEIETGKFEKVVPSRFKSVLIPASFDIADAFQNLCDRYPNAMVSLVNTEGSGLWIGASPELLVSVDDNQIFRTVALAGTKAFEDGTNLKQVAWTQKEIEEQALVSRYIINCFKKIRLREFEEHGPKTVVAGNLMHLKTEFAVDMKATNFQHLGSVMLELLHPTSAVCGMPLEPSLEFLKQHEGYNREFYSGYLGPVNIQNNINVFVNLRCMQLFQGSAKVYAGAGVTIDSNPTAEWTETEMKMNTLLSVIL